MSLAQDHDEGSWFKRGIKKQLFGRGSCFYVIEEQKSVTFSGWAAQDVLLNCYYVYLQRLGRL